MNTLRETLARLGELASLATSYGWQQVTLDEQVCGPGKISHEVWVDTMTVAVAHGGFDRPDSEQAKRDAEFIAAANPTVILDMLRYIQELEDKIAKAGL